MTTETFSEVATRLGLSNLCACADCGVPPGVDCLDDCASQRERDRAELDAMTSERCDCGDTRNCADCMRLPYSA